MSRKRKNALIGLFFLCILPALVAVDRWAGEPVRKAIHSSLYPSRDWQKYHEKVFTVADVIDGDTIDLTISDKNLPATRIRLIGVDTPETKKPNTPVMYFGPEASEFTKQLCTGRNVTVLLDTVAGQRDRYGRLLAYIRLQDGTILNQRLIREGYGYADLRFEHSFTDLYIQLQDEARSQKCGLWKEVTRGQLPDWLRLKRPELLRAAQKTK